MPVLSTPISRFARRALAGLLAPEAAACALVLACGVAAAQLAEPPQPAASAPVVAPPEPAAGPASAAAPAEPPAPPPAAPSGPPAFQGLPWGASEAQIAQRFGKDLQAADCDAAARRDAVQRNEICERPQLARYEVAGIPFRLSLHLGLEQRSLQKVTLTHAGDAPAGSPASDSRWGERHRLLRMLLTQRYGGPESTHIDTEGNTYTATARWRVGATLIDLRSQFVRTGGTAPGREQFEITYLPVTYGEAGKL